MAIQYPKLEHTTLPSVEGFNGSFNILRDPPKSIFTKRIDKVGQNNDINNLVDDSSDRMNEAILVYARGVNPMVSVSYNNNSNNAGSFTNSSFGYGNNSNQGHHQGQSQAFLPYRIMDKGAFRPPVRGPRDLLPLSRQPRAWFEALTNPGYVDYTKQKYQPTKFRMIREMILKTKDDIKPNHSVKIEKGIVENMKMQNAINDKHINIQAYSGTRSLDHSNFTRDNVDVYKGIQENYEQVNATTNKQSHISHNLSDMKIDKDRYIGEKQYYESTTNPNRQIAQGLEGIEIDNDNYIGEKQYYNFEVNKGRDINVKTLDELNSNNKTSVKDVLQYELESGKQSGYTVLTEIPDMELERHMPSYSANSSMNDPTVYKRVEHQNKIELQHNLPQTNTLRDTTRIEDMDNYGFDRTREYKLPPSLNKGQFMNDGVRPTQDRAEIQFRVDPHKERIRKYMNETQFSRFDH
jgi:hypothetical protein